MAIHTSKSCINNNSMPSSRGRRRTLKSAFNSSSGIATMVLISWVCLLAVTTRCSAFGLGKIFSGKNTIELPSLDLLNNQPNNKIANCKAELIETLSGTQNGKDTDVDIQTKVLQLVGYLESNAPVSETLLTNPNESQLIDGQWYLQYTQPSEPEGVDLDQIPTWTEQTSTLETTKKLDSRRANNEGAVSFLGVVSVETANKVTTQTIGIKNSLFQNKVVQDFGTIEVSGTFENDSVPNRIVASFDTGKLTLKSGFVLDFSALFAIRALFKGKAGGWLETTYIDETMRIGRGNRGSLFVLTREKDAIEA